MKYLETLRREPDGSFPLLPWHQMRLAETWEENFPASQVPVLAEILDHSAGQGITRCRVIYDDQNIEVQYIPYQHIPLHSLMVAEAEIDYRRKYADRSQLEKIHTMRADADDVLIVQQGLVTDITVANIIFYTGKEWLTPANCLLKGTRRMALLAEKVIRPETILAKDIKNFTGWKPINAMRPFAEEPLRPITSIKNLAGV